MPKTQGSPRSYTDWVNPGCPKHKYRHQWRSDSSLCLHPLCLAGVIESIAKRSPSVGRRLAHVRYRQLMDDLVQHTAFYLLNEPGVKTLNSETMFYILSKFTDQGYLPKEAVHTNYVSDVRTLHRLDEDYPDERHDVLAASVLSTTDVNNPYTRTLFREIAKHLRRPALVLFAFDQIDAVEYARLVNTHPSRILELAARMNTIRPWLAQWVKQYAAT